MNFGAVGLIIVIGICYMILTLFMPALFLYKYIKDRRFIVRFASYQVVGNAWLIGWGFVFSLLNIWSEGLMLLVTIVIPLAVKIFVFRRDLFVRWRNYEDDKREKLVTARGTVREIRRRAVRKIKEWFDRYIRNHYVEIIILVALAVFAVWYYGYFKMHYFTYASSDEATHLYWVNSLFGGDPFPVGMYPHSMHFVMAAIHSISGLQTLIINHYFSVIIMLMIHFMIFLAVKELFRSAAAAIGSAGIFLFADMFTAQRYHNTLPMEFGMIAMLIMIVFFTEFIKNRDKYSMWMAALALGWTFHAHFYITIFCAFLWVAFFIVYLKTVIRLKAFVKSVLVLLIGIAVAIAPFGIGFAAGHPFEQSIGWALGVIGTSDGNESNLSAFLQGHTRSDEEDADEASEEDENEEEAEDKSETGSDSGTEDKSNTDSESGTEDKSNAGETSKDTEAEEEAETAAPEPVKELTAQQIEFQAAETPGEYLAAAEHLLTLRFLKDEMSALIFYGLIAFAFIYGIAELIYLNLTFRKKEPKPGAPDDKAAKKEWKKRKQEYLVRNGLVIVVPLMLIAGTGCFVMSYFGLPELIDDSRAAMILTPLAAFLFAPPIKLIEDLLKLIPVKNKKAIETFTLLLAGCGLGAFYVGGPLKQLETVGCYAVTQEASNKLSYDLIATHPRGTWTVISPVNDLLGIRYYGYHYEIIDLLMEIEDGEKNIYMPTNDLYVIVEKRSMNAAGVYYLPDYHKELAEQSYQLYPEYVDLNYYDTGLPWMSPAEAYASFRNITMTKLYYWMEEIKKAYPNEVEVYSDDDLCTIYHLRQSADFPLNLAIDYRVVNYGVDARDDFERRYAEMYGTEYVERTH